MFPVPRIFRICIGILLALLVIAFLVARIGGRYSLSPPDVRGGVVRLQDASGDRLYFLTTQWHQRKVSRYGRTITAQSRTISWLYTDLWVLDVATAQPVLRRRLKRAKVNPDSVAMGVDQGVLWARVPELIGIRLADGEIVADSVRIEARNPALAGLLPKPPESAIFLTQDMQPLKFIADVGLVILLADARRVHVDPLTLAATPYSAPDRRGAAIAAAAGQPGPRRIPLHGLSNGTDWRTLLRGLRLDSQSEVQPWMGLIADEELADPATLGQHVIANWWDYSKPQRQRLYRAELRPVENAYGKVLGMMPPVPLPDTPEFVMGGLLTEGESSWQTHPALRRRDPDSVFVLSRDRLGEGGHLQLARIAAPEGRVLWSGPLPLSDMSVWLPGERHALMVGPDSSAPRSAMAEENENPAMQIVSIDLVSGAVRNFSLDVHRDWPVDEIKESPQ